MERANIIEKIADYTILEKIGESGKSQIYRGKKDGGDKTVIIKVLITRYPSAAEIARFRHEHELIKQLDIDGVVKTYDLIDHKGEIALVLEDFKGVSLESILQEKKLSIKSFLQIAIKLATILGNLHKNNVVHKDIKPQNILLNPEKGVVKITDFGISAAFTHEEGETALNVIEGTLMYMSPEQTGRMNRVVDYRTDLYSLGITFYKMLTGDVPFVSNEPLEIIHSHIARKPVPPIEVKSTIPQMLSDIVMKLLSKTAEERYQNAFGLMIDLKNCLSQLETKGTIEPFEIGQQDISIKFDIPLKLFGRETELESLMKAFNRISERTSEMLLIFGAPGVGKTALVEEIHEQVITRGGYFISGKCDQFKKNIPYSAIIQAFQGLVKQLLSESEESIKLLKNDLLSALGNNGKVITDLIPAIELIIGKQPEVPALGHEEAQNRFNLVFSNFTGVFAKNNHPLVLFLDDLHWADAASLVLIKALMTDRNLKYFLLLTSYPENIVTGAHPIMSVIEDIKKVGGIVGNLSIKPLDSTNVNKLLSNFLRCREEKSSSFSEVVYQKTMGNPFFIHQFLRTLYEGGVLKVDPVSGWEWDIDKARDMQVTDNVVELMTARITKLRKESQELLEISSCIGNKFDIEMLSSISDKPIDTIFSSLTEIIDENLITQSGDIYSFYHDRIQEAAYSLIHKERRNAIHLQIGRYALEKTDEADLRDKVFFIVNQYNHGVILLDSPEERIKLAELNLMAGKKAKESAGFEAALNYLIIGVLMLPSDCWTNYYALSYSLYIERAEVEFINKDFDTSEKMFYLLLENSRTKIEKANVYNILLTLYTSQDRYQEAIKTGIEGLKMFGVKLSDKPSKLTIGTELIKAKLKMRKIKIDDIADLPEMQDGEKIAITNMFYSMGLAAYIMSQELFALMSLKAMNIYLKYGNTSYAPPAYVTYAAIISSTLAEYEAAYQITQMALKLHGKFNNKKIESTLFFTIGYMIPHWITHAKNDIEFLSKSYKHGLEVGDFICPSHATNAKTLYKSMLGENLDEVFREYEQFRNFIMSGKNPFAINCFLDTMQFYNNLKGMTKSKTSLSDDNYDEDLRFKNIREVKNYADTFIFYLTKMRIYYLFGAYAEAYELGKENDTITEYELDTMYYIEHYFYYALTAAALCTEARGLERKKYWRVLKKNRKRFKKWASLCEENFLHKYQILSAEMARLTGQNDKAMKLYYDAIKSARENGYTQNEAIAGELAARFYFSWGYDDLAEQKMREARHAYLRWGADTKVKDIDEKYPNIARGTGVRMPVGLSASTVTASSTTTVSEALDLTTVMKSTQAISGEIVLEKLLVTLMKIAIENAGAQKGHLILEEKGHLFIEASGEIDSEKVMVLQSIPVRESDELSEAIIYYVERTKEDVILNDATNEGSFTTDKYIVKNRPKSVLCAPIINQGRLVGILYLENNLTTGAFTFERIEVLRILSAQVAISIDNARLYANLEEKVRERTAELRKAHEALWGEMQLAKKIQTVLLPEEPIIEGYEIIGHMTPADEVGGDYYDVINVGPISWVIIGDVSGHGVPAGLIMMMVQTSIQTILREYPDMQPSVLLRIINSAITYNISKLEEDKYMTITAMSVDKSGRVVFSGLHQDILVYRAESNSVEAIPTDGMWLGISEDLGRENSDFEFKLNPGDTMILYTDGITEAKDNKDDMYGIEKLTQLITNYGTKKPEFIKSKILESMNNYVVKDDITMVVLNRQM